MRNYFVINRPKHPVLKGGTNTRQKILMSAILGLMLAVPCGCIAADISGPIASDKNFAEDTKVTGLNGVKTSSNTITIDASGSKLTLDNTQNGIIFSK